jgi:hypothetical protein
MRKYLWALLCVCLNCGLDEVVKFSVEYHNVVFEQTKAEVKDVLSGAGKKKETNGSSLTKKGLDKTHSEKKKSGYCDRGYYNEDGSDCISTLPIQID